MRSTLISILVGALVGALLTLGSSVHASRAAASRATPASGGIVVPAQLAPEAMARPAEPLATPIEQAPLTK